MAIINKVVNKVVTKFGKDIADIVEDVVEDAVEKSTKKVEKSTKKVEKKGTSSRKSRRGRDVGSTQEKKGTRGRKSRRGRPEGSTQEKKEALDKGFVKKDAQGRVQKYTNGNPKPDVAAYRKAQESANRLKGKRRSAIEEERALPTGIIETQGGGYQAGFPTKGTRQAILSSLETMPKGPERGEIGRLLRSQRAEDRPPAISPTQRRVPRTEGAESVGEGVNTRLRSLHRPDYKQVHDQAVAYLKREIPGKSEKWYEREAIKLVERDFPKRERGQEVISGPQSQIMRMMRGEEHAYHPEELAQVTGGATGGMEEQLKDLVLEFQARRGRKRGGIVRRRSGGQLKKPRGWGAARYRG